MIEPDIIRKAAPLLDELRDAEARLAAARQIVAISGLDGLIFHFGEDKWASRALMSWVTKNAAITKEDLAEAISIAVVKVVIQKRAQEVGVKRAALAELGVKV